MGNVTIPMLPQAIGLIGDEQIEIVQAGVSARVTLTQVAALGGPTGPPGGGPTGPTGTFGPTGPAGPNTAVSINYTPPFTGSVTETVAAKLAQTVSVLDFGADPTGVADSTAAITLAAAASNNVIFPTGAYLISGSPVIPAGVVLRSIGATFSGAGAGPLGFSTNPVGLYLEVVSEPNASINVGSTQNFVRLVSYTGGSSSTVHNAVRIQTNIGANVTDLEWALLSVLNNSATAGQNVAIYGQGNKLTGAGPTWGGTLEAHDRSGNANPTSGLVGLEVDVFADGADNNSTRVGIDVVGGVGISIGATIAYGVRIGPQNGVASNCNFTEGVHLYGAMLTGINIAITSGGVVGINTSAATLSGSALRIANNQFLGFDASDVHTLGLDGSANLKYSVSGVFQSGLNATGGILLNQGAAVLPGTVTANGAATPALTSNKPGTTTAIQAWANYIISGTTYCFPLYLPT